MKKTRKFLVAAGGVVAAVAASGGAFTAGLTTTADPTDVVSAGTVTVDGATVVDVTYTEDGTNISDVTVVFDDLYESTTVFKLWIGTTEFTAAVPTRLDSDTDTVMDQTRVVFSGSEPIASSLSTRIAVNGDVDTTP